MKRKKVLKHLTTAIPDSKHRFLDLTILTDNL